MKPGNRVLRFILFSGTFLAGLLAFAPSALVGYALERSSGGILSLAQTEGSLWHGSGTALLKSRAHVQVLEHYRWTLLPWRGALQMQAGEAAPMTVTLHPLARRIDIDALNIRLPATAFELLSTQLGPYQFMGMVEAHADHLSLDADGMKGEVSGDWKQAASGLSPIRPLGDYHIELHGNGSTIDAQLSTTSGKLILNAKGSFDVAHGLQINGTAQAAPEAADELREMLHHIGPETSPGVFSLALMPASR